MKVAILIFAVTDCKNQLSCGRALKPRPYGIRHSVYCEAVATRETSLYRI